MPRKGPLKLGLGSSALFATSQLLGVITERCCVSWWAKAFQVGRKSGLNVCKLSTFTAGISFPKTAENRKLHSAFFSLYLLLASHLRGHPLKVIAFGKEIRNCFRKGLFFQMTLLRRGCFFFSHKSVSLLISSLCSSSLSTSLGWKKYCRILIFFPVPL